MLALLLATSIVFVQSPQKLPTGDRNAANLYLSWSPDGKWLVYTQIELGDPPKFNPDKVSAIIVSSDGKERKHLDGPAMNAAFTTDGQSVVITRRGSDGKKNVLLRYDLDTKQATPLSPNDYNTTCPACSPVN